MILAYLSKKPFIKDSLLMLVFGVMSYVLGLIKFQIPGLETSLSDFREIPLLISILYIRNPFFLIGMSAISLLNNWGVPSYAPRILTHAISLIFTYYFYLFLKKQKITTLSIGFFWFVFVFIYFAAFILPFSFLTKPLFGLSLDIDFFPSYKLALISLQFEMLSTALITSLYLMQFTVQNELIKHKANLELTVLDRTSELKTTNEELKLMNEELFAKNDIINEQNAELNAILSNLKETQSQLLHADKMASLGVLTAGVAHEINNPLNFIMRSYEGLNDYFKENENEEEIIQFFLSSLKTGVHRATNIVNSLSQFSRTNSTNDENCDIHSIIDNCLLMLQNKVKDNIIINKNFSDETLIIAGNIGKLHQVFINVLVNAIQAIENKGIITINTKKQGENIVIEIIDTGSGISKENLSKITEPFFTTKEPGAGTGLGLSITYSIVKEHNGTIKFKSVENMETTVSFVFPVK